MRTASSLDPIELLMREHRQIERVLAVLVDEVAAVRAGGRPSIRVFTAAARFIRRYGDGVHHAKEEDVLFPAMVECGVPIDTGPVACMLREHGHGRAMLKQIDQSLTALGDGDREAQPLLLEAASGYAQHLAAHIGREDGFIYPLARQAVPEALLARMPAYFAQLDRALPLTLATAASEVERAYDTGRG